MFVQIANYSPQNCVTIRATTTENSNMLLSTDPLDHTQSVIEFSVAKKNPICKFILTYIPHEQTKKMDGIKNVPTRLASWGKNISVYSPIR